MKKISTKIIMSAIIITLFTASIIGVSSIYELFYLKSQVTTTLRQSMLKDYDENIKNEVKTAISMLDGINKKYEKKEITLEEAKKQGADLLRALKYGEEGYFWADTVDGVNVVLLGDETEGTNRLELKDSKGNYVVKEIINKGINGGGFSDYYFPKNGGNEPLPKRAYSEVYKPFDWVIGTGNYIDTIDKVIGEKEKALEGQIQKAITILLILILGSIALAVLIGLYLGNKISKPIISIKELVDKTSNLDLGYDEKYEGLSKLKDETGVMAKAVFDLRKHLRDITNGLKISSKEVLDSSDRALSDMNSNVESSEAISKTLDELARGSVDQATNSQQIVEMLTKLSDEINLAVNSTNLVKECSSNTESINREGRKTMDVLIEKFEENNVALSTIGGNINNLSSKSVSIGEIVNKIQDIAEQTNLLSLNAAIEAARAGEQGRGFAVVADEVRKLSEEVEESTREIARVIEEIQKEINNAKNSMSIGETIVGQVSEAVNGTQKVFNTIEDSTQNAMEHIEALYENINKVSEFKDSVLDSTHGISAISEEFAAGLEEVSASMEEQTKATENTMNSAVKLKDVANELDDIVKKFKL